jgi:ketosteroid isomerase-like protein
LTEDVQAICTGTSILSGTRYLNTILQTAAAFPQIAKNGFEFNIIELTAENDRVSCEMTGGGELVTGNTYNNEYHFLFYFRDGKICKFKEYLDGKIADEILAPLFAA